MFGLHSKACRSEIQTFLHMFKVKLGCHLLGFDIYLIEFVACLPDVEIHNCLTLMCHIETFKIILGRLTSRHLGLNNAIELTQEFGGGSYIERTCKWHLYPLLQMLVDLTLVSNDMILNIHSKIEYRSLDRLRWLPLKFIFQACGCVCNVYIGYPL